MNTVKKTILINLFSSVCVVTNLAYADVDRVWIKFKPADAEQAKSALINAGAEIHYRFDSLNAFAASVPKTALFGLLKNPNIEYIEEDAKRYPSVQTFPYGIDAVQARDVWDMNRDGHIDAGTPTGNGRTVCIIDSGIKSNHEDFATVNLIGGHPSNWNTDTCGHGTHVAGTIAAASNDKGVVGTTPGAASLYIVKVFDGPSCGWSYSSDLVDAANRCQTAGANIINMSLGGTFKSRTEQTAFNRLYRDGILSIAAAGNDGNTRKSYPASYDSVISVAAVDSDNAVASFSQQNDQVELSAPGVSILSTVPFENTVTAGGNTYNGGHIENAAWGTATGSLVDGGLCDSINNWDGMIVLCERGDISFFDKVNNIQTGGGSAAIIYNNVPGAFSGTLSDGNSSNIPAISLSQEAGQTLLSSHLGLTSTVVSSANGNGYEAWSGTSMATPHVSGVAALVWSSDPSLPNVVIRDAITTTALDLGVPDRDNAYGYGLVQAYDAWQFLGGSNLNNPAPTASFIYSCSELSCSFDASGSSGNTLNFSWDFGDDNFANGINPTHSYASAGNYTVTLTVTDDQQATSQSSQTLAISDSNDTTPPTITNVSAEGSNGNSFVITWTTDEPSNSSVIFSCCGEYSDTSMVTDHRMSFRGNRNTLYSFTVSSTDAVGNSASSGPYEYQN